MKKIFQRTINVILILFIVFATFIAYDTKEKSLETFIAILGFGAFLVLGLNYIFFGKFTVWHKADLVE